MPDNLTRQILRQHLVEGELVPGRPISLRVDQTLLQDATGTMALMQFEQLDVPRVRVERAVQYVDHNVIQLDYKNPDDHRMRRRSAQSTGSTTRVPATASATTFTSNATRAPATSSSAPTRTPPRAARSG